MAGDNGFSKPLGIPQGLSVPQDNEALRLLAAKVGAKISPSGQIDPGSAGGSADMSSAEVAGQLKEGQKQLKDAMNRLEVASKTPGIDKSVIDKFEQQVMDMTNLFKGIRDHQVSAINNDASGGIINPANVDSLKAVNDILSNNKLIAQVELLERKLAAAAILQQQAMDQAATRQRHEAGAQQNRWTQGGNLPGGMSASNGVTSSFYNWGAGSVNSSPVVPIIPGSGKNIGLSNIPNPQQYGPFLPNQQNVPMDQFMKQYGLPGWQNTSNPFNMSPNAQIFAGAGAVGNFSAAAAGVNSGANVPYFGLGGSPTMAYKNNGFGGGFNPNEMFGNYNPGTAGGFVGGPQRGGFGAGGYNQNPFNNPVNIGAPNNPGAVNNGLGGFGGGGGGTPPPPGAPGGPDGPGNEGNNGGGFGGSTSPAASSAYTQFLIDIKDANRVYTEFRAKQKYGVNSPLTREDTKETARNMKTAIASLMTDSSVSDADKGNALEKFMNSMTKFEGAYKEQSESSRKVANFVTGAFSTLQLGQLASKMMISDPLQYNTMPALKAMGSTGKQGAALSSALGASESWKAEQDQTVMGMGMNGMMGSMLLANPYARAAGLAVGAGATLLGATHGGSAIRDAIGKFTGTPDSQTITQNNLAATYSDPNTLLGRQQLSQGMFTAMGNKVGASGEHLTSTGNYINDGVKQSKTGNYFLDQLDKQKYNGLNLTDLGMDIDAQGQLLTQMGGGLNNKTQMQKDRLTQYAGVMGAGLGIEPSSLLPQFQAMQANGIVDLQKNTNESLGVYANAKGEVSQFAANVLQPALAKVAQGIASKNVSMSAEKMTENVNAFQRFLSVDMKNTELGKRALQDPTIMAGIVGGIDSNVKESMNSTQGIWKMEHIYGVSASEALRKSNDPLFQAKMIDNFAYNYGITNKMLDKDGNLPTQLVKNYADENKLDFNTAEAVLKATADLHSKGDTLEAAEGRNKNYLTSIAPKVGTAAASNASTIAGDALNESKKNMAAQSSQFSKTVLTLEGKILEVQTETLNYTSSAQFVDDVKAGMTALVKKIEELIHGMKPKEVEKPGLPIKEVSPPGKYTSKGIFDALPDAYAVMTKSLAAGNVDSAQSSLIAMRRIGFSDNGPSESAAIQKLLPADLDISKLDPKATMDLLKKAIDLGTKSSAILSQNTISSSSIKYKGNLAARTTGTASELASTLTSSEAQTLQHTILNDPNSKNQSTNMLNLGNAANEDQILDRIYAKTKAKMASATGTEKAGLQQGLGMLQVAMKSTDKSKVGAYAIAAANNGGVLDASKVSLGANGRAYSASGTDVGAVGEWYKDANGTMRKTVAPAKKPKAAPTPPKATLSSTFMQNGKEVVVTFAGLNSGETVGAAIQRMTYGGNALQDRRSA